MRDPLTAAGHLAWKVLHRTGYPAAWLHSEPSGLLDPSDAVLRQNQFLVAGARASPPATVLWFVPAPSKFYGGMRTIVSLMRWLAESHGVRAHVAFLQSDPRRLARAKEWFARELGLPQSAMHAAGSPEDVRKLPGVDAAVATNWPSAYALLHYTGTGRKFYFVQDFEPMFSPASVDSALAANTYGFGFRLICNTPGVLQAIGPTAAPAITLRLPYWPKGAPSVGEKRRLLLFYGRPSIFRNGFGIGAAALRQVHARHPDWDLVSFGAAWQPRRYGLEGVVRNEGFAPAERIAELMAQASIGLCLTMTPSPALVAYEFFESSVAVVTNETPWNAWLFKDGANCLAAPPLPSLLAGRIHDLIENPRKRSDLAEVGRHTVQSNAFAGDADRLWSFLSS